MNTILEKGREPERWKNGGRVFTVTSIELAPANILLNAIISVKLPFLFLSDSSEY